MDPWSLNLRQLRAFAATARMGSVSKGAETVAISQPGVTQAIAKLEALLGTALFIRHARGMTATPAAIVLTERIERALGHIASRRVTAVQIRALLMVAEHGNYMRAAGAAGLSQPSIHRAVGDLSIALRRALIERRGKTIALTEAGRRVARSFRLARAELSAGIAEVTALIGRETGQITIGAMPLCRARLLPSAVAAFHRENPEFTVRIIEGSHADLVEPLHDGSIDLMIGALRDGETGAVSHALFDDRPVVVSRPGHPLAGGTADVDAFAHYPWVVSAPGTPLRTLWERLFTEAGHAVPPVRVECGSVIAIREIMRASDFLSLLSYEQVAAELRAGWLVRLCDAPPSLVRTIGVTTRADWRPTPLQARFVSILHGAAVQSVSVDL